ncbi:3-oxoacyl-[acyl-carrier-protein] synthase 2 [Botrimarina colliarenosi]|uniref:3-oxoacyl-[acyl-carrier-protein] synthase 2 n=1 Tax=Botrimarina colliarenosi TaxID=2528001 RepID=A0A5C6ADT4_9BACT|nr:beta-ketoacyl-[acyl-carrier-protein] synthase family protein [Botrimarina colliarenosi]TWT98134.1 3-oxoacyl-[acyl-carrier-protein] synthase 2 [Botrimarina colliarenosi]
MSSPQSAAERRVVITGVGLVSPLGLSPAEFAGALAAGRSGVSRRDGSDAAPQFAGFAGAFTGAIGDFGDLEGDAKKAIRKGLKLMCRETQMAVAAAQHALTDALTDGDTGQGGVDPERCGVVLGSDYMLTLPDDYADAIAKCCGEGGVDNGAFQYERWGDDGLDQMQPLWMLKYLPNMPASHIAIYNDLRGPNNSLTMREASGLMALGEAFRIIARGDADRMIAGATGTRVLPMQAIHALQEVETPLVGQQADGADPATLSKPFDRARRGMVCGEGAGMVVLESLASAEARGARIYGEVVGFGSSVVTERPTAGKPLQGRNEIAIANALRGAMSDAGVEPSELGHVNADGVGAPAPDHAEAVAIRAALGDAADTVPVVALKSYFGSLGAGSGVVELIGSLLALDESGPLAGKLPATLNHTETDPECPIQVAAQPGTPAGDVFVSVNTTPQGQAAAVCVRRG